MCPNGTVNWKQIYGEEAFVLKSPIFESELRARRKLKEVNIEDLEQRARSYAKQQCETQGISYDQVEQHAQQTLTAPVQAAAPAELPPGWAVAHDANGKPYYWHKKTQKTTWVRPTAETPIE